MGWQLTVLSLPILLSIAVSAVLLGYLVAFYRDRRRDSVVVLYGCITVAAIVWTGFSALKLLQTDPATKLLFFRLLHIGAAPLPPLLFLFVAAFIDRTRWLRYDAVGALFVLPAVFLLLLFVGPPGLVTGDVRVIRGDLVVLRVANGPGFLVFSVYSVALVLATLGVVLFESRRVGPAYYPQALLIAVAVTTPMLFSVLTTAEVPPFVDDRINLVPTAAAVSVLSFGVLLYRYRLVDLPPLAYATAMRYSPDALFILDREGRVVSTNERAGELIERLDSRLGSPLSAFVPAFDPGSTSNRPIELAPAPEETTYYRVFEEPLTRGGTRVGRVVVLRNETEQQRQQQRLEKRTEQMEIFASAVSHDLRNPLSIAQGYLELAREEVESEELDRVERAHTRMEEIVEEVLTLARAAGEIDDLEAVPVRVVLEDAWANSATADAELAVEVDRTVMADPTMLQHVFENLFRNAVEHGSTGNRTESGDSVEHGSTDSRAPPDDAVEHRGDGVTVTVGPIENGIYVEDDGAGIPPAERAAVFEVGHTGTADGTGLGLSIVEQIVTAHGWEISVTEGSEGGARFEITGIDVVD